MAYSPLANSGSSSSSPFKLLLLAAAAADAPVGVPALLPLRLLAPLPGGCCEAPNREREARGAASPALSRRGTPTVTASWAAEDSSRSRAAAMNLASKGGNRTLLERLYSPQRWVSWSLIQSTANLAANTPIATEPAPINPTAAASNGCVARANPVYARTCCAAR